MSDRFNFSLTIYDTIKDPAEPPVNMAEAIERDEVVAWSELAELLSGEWSQSWSNPHIFTVSALREKPLHEFDFTLEDRSYDWWVRTLDGLERLGFAFKSVQYPRYEFSGELRTWHPAGGSQTVECSEDGVPILSSATALQLLESSTSLDEAKDKLIKLYTIQEWKELVGER